MASAFQMEVSSARLERAAAFAGHAFAAPSEDEAPPPAKPHLRWASLAAASLMVILVAIALM